MLQVSYAIYQAATDAANANKPPRKRTRSDGMELFDTPPQLPYELRLMYIFAAVLVSHQDCFIQCIVLRTA